MDLSDPNASEGQDANGAPSSPPAAALPPFSATSSRASEFSLGGLTFGCDFDSGNIGRIELKGDDEYVMWTRADCEGTPNATKSRTWFCFSVRGALPGQELKFDVKMTPQVKLYEHGMRPVFRSLPSQPEWARVPRSTPCNGLRQLDSFSIRIRHVVETPANETLFFAFCYPLTYGDLMGRLAWLDALFGDEATLRNRWLRLEQLKMRAAGVDFKAAGLPPQMIECEAICAAESAALHEAAFSAALAAGTHDGERKPADVRATGEGTGTRDSTPSPPVAAAMSTGPGLSELASITDGATVPETFGPGDGPSASASAIGCSGTAQVAVELAKAAASAAASLLPAELPLDSSGAPAVHYRRELLTRSVEGRRVDLITITGQPHPHPNIAPDLNSKDRANRPRRKRVVLLSARVHPGETPATHVIDGVIRFLLRPDDPRAIALRSRFVFKLIPMLNPDGVFRGHYRSDTGGVNLNRMYIASAMRRDQHPSVAAYMTLVRKLQADGDLALCVDMHAHAGRRGCFFYGTRLDTEAERVESALFAKLVAKNSVWFDYDGCNWFISDGTDGSARSFVTAATAQQGQVLPLVYTLECNYDSGVAANQLQKRCNVEPSDVASGRLSPEPAPIKNTMGPKYTPESWRDIGQAIVLAMLDYEEANSHSRLGGIGTGWLPKLRAFVASSLQKREAEKKPPRPPKEGDSEGEEEAPPV
jgi:hypothetical protein